MSAPEPAPDGLAVPLRWLGRAVVVAAGLWFITDGLRAQWSAADTVAVVLVWVGVALAAAFVVVGLVHLARRGRDGGPGVTGSPAAPPDPPRPGDDDR